MAIINASTLTSVALNIFKGIGISEEEAGIISEHLVGSNLRGHDSHGIIRIPTYVAQLEKEYVSWDKHEVLSDEAGITIIEGHGVNGIVAATRAAELAVENTKQSVFSTVTLRNTTHIGRLGDYAELIAKKNLIGMIWTNVGGKFVVPFGSGERRLRPNPMAFGIPRMNKDPIVLDISLSSIAGGKVDDFLTKGKSVPEGWLIDSKGDPVTDGTTFRGNEDAGALPLGGMQFGHKGFGLAMIMEMIVGPLSRAGCTKRLEGKPGITSGNEKDGGGVMIVAIDIEKFTSLNNYNDEIEQLLTWVKSAKPLPGFSQIYAPGEMENNSKKNRLDTGIDVPDSVWEKILVISKK